MSSIIARSIGDSVSVCMMLHVFFLALVGFLSCSYASSSTGIDDHLLKKNFTRVKLLRRAAQCSYLGAAPVPKYENRHLRSKSQKKLLSSYPVWAQNTSLYVLGALKRNQGDEEGLKKVTNDLRALLEHWPSYTVIVYGDSGAREYFRALVDPCVYLIRETFTHPSRTHRLAHARNALWNQTRVMSRLRNEDPSRVFVLMIDLDEINAYGFRFDVLGQVMSETDQWDVLSFYRRWYYDVWALRYEPYNLNSVYTRVNGSASIVQIIQEDIQRVVPASGLRYFPVLSAFAGLAFYKLRAGDGCAYLGRNPDDPPEMGEDCEHVAFHRCARERNGARIMMFSQPFMPS